MPIVANHVFLQHALCTGQVLGLLVPLEGNHNVTDVLPSL